MSRIVRGNSEEIKELEKAQAIQSEAKDFRGPEFQAFRSPDLVSIEEANKLSERAKLVAKQEAFAQAEQQLKAPLNQALQNLEGVLDEVSHFRRELFQEAEEEVVELIQRLCKMILGEELRHDAELLKQVVQKALMVVEKERYIKMIINPSDFKTFQQAKSDFLEKFQSKAEIDIEMNSEIPQAGALIQTDTRQVDMTIDQMVGHLIQRAKDEMTETKETGDDGDKV